MRKTIWTQVLALMLTVLLFAGCAANSPSEEPTTPPAASTPETTESTETIEPTENGSSAAIEHEHQYIESEVIAATCSAEGYTVYVCDCGDTYNDNYTDKAEHTFEETVIASTTEIEGYTLYMCTVCGYAYKDNYTNKIEEVGLTEQQKNSYSMLYYLAITAEEIRTSSNNRLILDDIYTSLLNDINPGAIDEITQDHLQSLRDIIKRYIDISFKREQLQYIYNQDKASAIHSAVPDPLAVLSMANSFDWKKLAVSAVYTVVDSYSNYKSATTAADQTFLMSGWDLDEEERTAFYNNRDRAFNYMATMVREYDLDGLLTLNEEAIETFAEICSIGSLQQKIRRLQSEEETYKLLGNYWLELADCYFETGQYKKCLDCVAKYNDLATGIYRKDYNYVQILPKAIVAAQEIYSGDDYIANVGAFADAIMKNTTTEEWSVRYFAAQVYLDLYARTNDRIYLEKAYNIAYDNVTILLDEQRALNATYIAEVEEVELEEPDYRFMTEDEKKAAEQEYKDEQKRLKAYNKQLKKSRKSELPPLYEPLILNCDLLFALAEKMNISHPEKAEIEAILQTNTNGVFLVKPVNDRYSFFTATEKYSISFSKDEILIGADLIISDARIMVTVTDNGKTVTFDDCTVTKVERQNSDISSFIAHITSEKMKDYQWTKDSAVIVEIYNGDIYEPISFDFKVKEYKANWWIIPDKVVFEEA